VNTLQTTIRGILLVTPEGGKESRPHRAAPD
jgi:hypothetical protein